MNDAAPIFISYRRSDAGGHARALHEYLSGRFGPERVFFDRSTIEGGDVFTDTIREGVKGCAALLALIAPEWLEVKGADGNRRLENAADIVRQEIGLALELGKKVIPILFDDTPVPPADRLPGPLKALASRDAVTLRGKTYEYDTQLRELVRLLAEVPGVPAPFATAGDALKALGEHESGTTRLEQAVVAYREALQERTLERVPLDWAMTRNSLGTALATLGEQTGDQRKLKEARDAIDGAFDVFMQAGQEHRRARFEERLSELDRKIAELTQQPGA
jgi:hypothetical protein